MPEPLRLPIHPRLRALLNARKAKVEAEKIDDGGYVMPSLAGASKTKTVSERIANVFDKCGITRKVKDDRGLTKSVASFHSLRHTFVSYSLQAGVPLSVIQRVVGHSSASMTSHYFHANEAVIADGMAKLPDLMVKSRGKGKPQGFKTLALTSEVYELLMKRVGSGDVSDYLKRLLTATEKAVVTLDPMKAVA